MSSTIPIRPAVRGSLHRKIPAHHAGISLFWLYKFLLERIKRSFLADHYVLATNPYFSTNRIIFAYTRFLASIFLYDIPRLAGWEWRRIVFMITCGWILIGAGVLRYGAEKEEV